MQHNVNVGCQFVYHLHHFVAMKNLVENMNANRVHLNFENVLKIYDTNLRWSHWDAHTKLAPDPSCIRRYHEKSSHWVGLIDVIRVHIVGTGKARVWWNCGWSCANNVNQLRVHRILHFCANKSNFRAYGICAFAPAVHATSLHVHIFFALLFEQRLTRCIAGVLCICE